MTKCGRESRRGDVPIATKARLLNAYYDLEAEEEIYMAIININIDEIDLTITNFFFLRSRSAIMYPAPAKWASQQLVAART